MLSRVYVKCFELHRKASRLARQSSEVVVFIGHVTWSHYMY